jgi:ATP-dependent protease ClpP protease subunit
MFEDLIGFVPETQTPDTPPASTEVGPPIKFGATRIVIATDPDSPVISIIERKNPANQNDYMVFISQYIMDDGSYYAELTTLLKTLTAASKVVIFIGSPGGSLNVGAIIASAVKSCKAEVTTVAIGVVASAAALIWSYGHKRIIQDGAVLMFHMSSHTDYGNSADVKARAENTVRYVNEVAIKPLVDDGLLTAAEAETIVDGRRDLWLDSSVVASRLEALHV